MNTVQPQFDFLPGCQVIRPEPTQCALQGPRGTVFLNWTNRPIFRLYEIGAVDVNPQTICAFARFAFDNLKSELGQFIIVEPDDDIPWQPGTSKKQIDAIKRYIAPMRCDGRDSLGLWSVRSSIIFRRDLYRASIKFAEQPVTVRIPKLDEDKLFAAGEFALLDEVLIGENLPIAEPWLRGLLP